MRSLMLDVRYAIRALLRAPLFTGVALATLALGIGANTAVFSVIEGVLLRPAPVEDLDRLAMVWGTDRVSGTRHEPTSVPDFLDFARLTRRFGDLAAVLPVEANVTAAEADPFQVAGMRVSHRFLPMLGIRPRAGRGFAGEEDRPGGTKVALVSERLWRRDFGGEAGALGRTLRIDDVPYTIVGVLPDDADFGVRQVLAAADYGRSFGERGGRTQVDVWLPLQADPAVLPRETHPIFVLGRLAPRATHAQAQAELAAVAAELERTYPENTARSVNVQPLSAVVFGPARPALGVLLGAVALLLLIACANVANLLLARGASRVRELAVRAALGAGPGRLARQFLVESLVLTLLGAALGVLVAYAGLDLLLALAPGDIPRLSAVGIDLRVLALTLGVSTLVGIAFGMIPTLQARRFDLQAALKGTGVAALATRDRGRVRSALVVGELALAVVLTVGAGLLVKSFWELHRVDPGFRADGVLKAEFQLPEGRYPQDFAQWPNWPAQQRFVGEVLREAEALPGVEAAAVAASHPLAAGFTNGFQVVGREAEAENWPEISFRQVTPGYFRTMDVPLREGRAFRAGDDASAPRVMVINETSRRRFFPRGDALGQRIRLFGREWTVVGVVGDEHIRGLAEAAPPAAYVALAQAPLSGAGSVLVRAQGDPAALARPLAGAVRRVDPGLAVFALEPLETTLSQSLGQRRFTMLLLTTFAGLAVVLAVVGVYGVLSYLVARRIPELGIRLALGASRREIVGLVVRQASRLALAGLGLGLVGALAATRLLRGLVWGVSTVDPLTYGAVALVLAAAAVLASWVPAWRAARVDPLTALRSE